MTEKPDTPHGAAWPFRSLGEILSGLMLDRKSLKPGDEADFDPRPKSMAQKATAGISAAFSSPLSAVASGVALTTQAVKYATNRVQRGAGGDRIVSESEAAGFANIPPNEFRELLSRHPELRVAAIRSGQPHYWINDVIQAASRDAEIGQQWLASGKPGTESPVSEAPGLSLSPFAAFRASISAPAVTEPGVMRSLSAPVLPAPSATQSAPPAPPAIDIRTLQSELARLNKESAALGSGRGMPPAEYSARQRELSDEIASVKRAMLSQLKPSQSLTPAMDDWRSAVNLSAESAAEPSGNPAIPETTFTTSKGSTYVAHADGTTTRNKAARPEHPGEEGPQARSSRTWYVTPDQAQLLGEVQIPNGPKREIGELPSGRIGMRYTSGPQAGKFERRTVVQPQTQPGVGMVPVEVWQGKKTGVHFGNEITSVSEAQQNLTPESSAVASAWQQHQDGYPRAEDVQIQESPRRENKSWWRSVVSRLAGSTGQIAGDETEGAGAGSDTDDDPRQKQRRPAQKRSRRQPSSAHTVARVARSFESSFGPGRMGRFFGQVGDVAESWDDDDDDDRTKRRGPKRRKLFKAAKGIAGAARGYRTGGIRGALSGGIRGVLGVGGAAAGGGAGAGGAAAIAAGGAALTVTAGVALVVAVVGLFAGLVKALTAFGDAVNRSNERLGQYNATILAESERRKYAMLRREMERSVLTQDSAVRASQSSDWRDQQWEPAATAATELTNNLATMANNVVGGVGYVADKTGIDELLKLASEGVQLINDLSDMLARWTGWKKAHDEKKDAAQTVSREIMSGFRNLPAGPQPPVGGGPIGPMWE